MSRINNYFSNNNIFNGTEIPTQGKFDVGDIVINIGENAEEEPMWMCIEAGEPGVWKVVGKVEEMDLSGLLTESKDLVGAINELFQSANNGKQLIANAIGEPLDSNDTFSAMSSDINSLLSTFKTNMMNNGIAVESNDKFKALIDKIATLVDSEGKGVQFVVDVARTNEDGKLYVSGLPFKPIFFLTYMTDPVSSLSPDTKYYNLCFNIGDITTSVRYNNGTFQDYSTLDSITDDGFVASVYRGYNHWDSCGYEHTYYVIGVGEEDTTLRDSLASILQEEGVSVTEEDDMASLITKVDEEFDRKNVEIKNKPTLISYTGTGLSVSSKEKCIISNLYSHNSSSQTVTVNLSDLVNSNFSIKSISIMIKNECSADWAVKVSIYHYRDTQLIKTIANQVATSSSQYYSRFDITDIQANDTFRITGYDGGYTSGSNNYPASIYMYYLCNIE